MSQNKKASWFDSPEYQDFYNEEGDAKSKVPVEEKDFASMLGASLAKSDKKLQTGDKIKSEVLSIGKDDIFVSTGTRHDGLVSKRDLIGTDGVFACKVGDPLELYVTFVRGTEIRLSPNKTSKNFADDLEDAFDMMLAVEGRVSEICKGGVRVSIMGKTAFCPISQLDSKRIDTADEYIGKKLEFRITQFSEGGRNIVVSRRKLLDEERELNSASFATEHKIGELMQATITRIEKFGAFAEIAPGIEGLIHVSEMGWSRIANPAEVVSMGQKFPVKLIKIDEENGKLKISLSIKQAQAAPWDNVPEKIQVGKMVSGKITKCLKFGAFIELAPGIEALIPMSEMSYVKRVMKSDELFKEGETVTVMIKEIHPETRKVLASFKDAGDDPWDLIATKFPVGATFKGKLERREGYGLFVQVEEGITALLPRSKAMEDPEFPYEKYKVGDTFAVQVLEIKPEERRMTLCVPKDPEADAWRTYSPQGSTGGFNTMGGSLGDALKLAMEKKGAPEKKSKK